MRDLYNKKNISYFKNTRSEILPLLPHKAENIFEIGCGAGDTLAYIKKTNISKWVGGIEIYKKAAKKARKKGIDLVLTGNIETQALKLRKKSLDVILCLDVLEHMIDPWAVLKKIKPYLKDNGMIICSLPNIRNYKVLLPLMFLGHWNYSEQGILDKTHLRFFTEKSALELLNSSGYNVEKIEPLIYGKNIFLNNFTFKLFAPFFHYQYLIKARK